LRGLAIYPYRNPLVQIDLPQPDSETRLILNHQSARYVRLGPREFDWLIRLDGQTSRENIAAYLGMDSAFADEFLRRLEAAKLILFSETPVRLTQASQPDITTSSQRVLEWTQFGQLRIRFPRIDPLLTRLSKNSLLRSRLFLAILTWIALLGIAVGFRLLQVETLATLLQHVVSHRWNIVALMLLIFLTTAIHELGHAVVCTHFGAPVRSMGVMLYYLQPAAYADVTDSWRLANKWHRVAISAAGVYVQAIVNAFAVVIIIAMRISGRHAELLLLYVAMNLFTLAFNLLPFVRFDGYWMLSAMLAIPNLRDRAIEWWQVFAASKITRRPINEKALRYNAVLNMTPMGRSLLALFGLSSHAFGIAMWAGGLSFLLQFFGWLGVTGGRSLIVVAALLALGVAVFLILRRMRARHRPAPVAPVPALTPPPVVTHQIDRTRSVRLNPFAAVFEERKGTLIFAWTSANQVAVQGASKMLDLLPQLRKGTTLRELENIQGGLDSQTEQAFQRLWQTKHLRYSTDWELKEGEARYSRQLGWLSFNSAACGSESAVLSKLKTKSIAILGVGGVGSNVALSLAACGIGELHLVDGDTVELTNLNRQLLYTPSDVGRLKTDVAAERLAQFDPSLRLRKTNAFLNSVDDVMKVIKGADFVIRSLDSPFEAQYWVNEACVRSGIPCSGAGFLAQGAIVGPTVVPGVTACLSCNQAAQLPRFDRGLGPTIAPIVTITSGILANEAITYLGGLGQVRTTSTMVLIEAPTFNTLYREISRDENCLVCGVKKEALI
jgi:molybdopterin/thiamine biosynthesis adenylyltransferase/Zn-dependent protease